MREEETYNDDLAWILEKLSDRAGADYGLILRFANEDREVLTLAKFPQTHEPATDGLAALQIAASRLGAANESNQANELTHDGQRLLFLKFQPEPGTTILAAVGRHSGSFSLIHRSVAHRLHPVLHRYVRLWWMHRCERRRAAAIQRSMDLCDLGLVLLDRRSRVTYANQFGRQIIEQKEGLTSIGGTIAAANHDESVRLQAALQHAILTNALGHRNDAAPRAPMLSLRRAGKRPLIVTVVGFDEPAIDPHDVAAIVYIVDPESDLSDMLAPVCRLYRLAASEGRLVACLVGGSTLAEAAEELRITPATARGYLKQVFAKTATNRQPDLIRLMLASASRTAVGVDLTLL